MKILAIDDDFSILRNLQLQLRKLNWQVQLATSFAEAEARVCAERFDVIICDYELSRHPESKDGLALLEKIRNEQIVTPIIFLTGKQIFEISPWHALDSGADDFVTKPYRFPELVARVKAVYRRTCQCTENTTNMLKHSDISLDLDLQHVFLGKKEIRMSATLFRILQKFLQKPNELISYEEMMEYLWGTHYAITNFEMRNKLRVHMTHLKQKLGKRRAQKLRTVHAQGYVWQIDSSKK